MKIFYWLCGAMAFFRMQRLAPADNLWCDASRAEWQERAGWALVRHFTQDLNSFTSGAAAIGKKSIVMPKITEFNFLDHRTAH
jgi:hypothetical protein